MDLGKALITPEDLKDWSDRVENYLKFVVVPLCTSAVARPLLSQLMSQSFTFTVHIVPLLPAHTVRLFLYFKRFSFYQHIFYLKSEKLEEILDDPSTSSFNCDETFVFISPVKNKVLATMETKDVYLVQRAQQSQVFQFWLHFLLLD